MDLEERTIEQLPNSCENCGAELTDAEKSAALEANKSPVLCATCAAEVVPPDEQTESGEAGA